MSKRKIYQIEDLAFIYKKNAKAEGKFEVVELEEQDFAIAVKESKFMDAEDFLKNNPKFMPGTEFDDFTDIEISEPEKKEIDFSQKFEELQNQINSLKNENKELKKGKLNLNFEQVQELVAKKSDLLKQLFVYKTKKTRFEELQFTDDNTDILDSTDMRLVFTVGESEYNRETTLTTSSKLVLSEFIPFILIKLNAKIIALREEIETINF